MSEWREKTFVTTVGFLIVFAFSVSMIALYSNGLREKIGNFDKNGKCHDFHSPSNSFEYKRSIIPYLELEKVITFIGRWEYSGSVRDLNGTEYSYSVKLACPSVNRDALVYVNGELALRSDGKSFSETSKINYYDCNNNLLYTTETGSFVVTVLNKLNKFDANFVVKNPVGETIGYLENKNLFNIDKKFVISDTNGNTVIEAKKDITNFPWTWEIETYNQTSLLYDLKLWLAVFAHASFSESKDKTDPCNQYYFVALILTPIIAFIWLLCVYYFWIHDLMIKRIAC